MVNKSAIYLPNFIKNCALITILYALLGSILLLLVFNIPTSTIKHNIQISKNIIRHEGFRPNDTPYLNSYRENATDCLILLQAQNENNKTLLDKALKVYHKTYQTDDSCQNLLKSTNNITNYQEKDYARYWHGYLIFLKPLFSILSLDLVRQIFSCLHIYLMLVIFVLLIKQKLWFMIIPYGLTLLFFINPYQTGKSLTYSTCAFISSLAIITLLTNKEKLKTKLPYFFFIIGITTSFFDFLTYPLVTFGLPMYFYIFLNFSNSAKETIKKTILLFCCWFAGYTLMWSAKWILATILTDKNIIQDALEQIIYRTSFELKNGEGTGSILLSDTISRNIIVALDNPQIYQTTTLCLIVSLIFILKNQQLKSLYLNLLQILPLILLPFLWYALISNHSYIHCWFTFKILSISYFSILGTFIYTAFQKSYNHLTATKRCKINQSKSTNTTEKYMNKSSSQHKLDTSHQYH